MKKPKLTLSVIILLAIGVVLILRLVISLNRQFDPDEFAYLHWAYLLSRGKLPYQDFFYFLTPLYTALFIPLFLLPYSSAIAVIIRVLTFFVYILTLWLLYIFAKRVTGGKAAALLTVLIFSTFPMTFDKTIDIRPDMVMILFFLIGTVLLLKRDTKADDFSIRQPAGSGQMRDSIQCVRGKIRLFLSGFFFSLSFLTMFKIIFAVPATLHLLITTHKGKFLTKLSYVLLGAFIPVSILFLYIIKTGLTNRFFYAITHDAFVSNTGSSSFPFWMSLSPWPLIYVAKAGVSFPWILNSALWLLMIPGFFFLLKQHRQIGIYLLLLLGGAIIFICLFPMPFVQYFIMPSLIASIAASCLFQSVPKAFRKKAISLFVLLLLFSFIIQAKGRISPSDNNREQLDVLESVLSVVKENEPVYDMVGSFVFRPDGYYICCHPYGRFAHLLKSPVPTLSESLIASKTKFLVMDQKGYVFWTAKPEDLQFLTTHYLPSKYKKIYTLGVQYQCANGWCIQLNVHGTPAQPTGGQVSDEPKKAFGVVIEEQYKIIIQPENQSIIINGNTYENGDTADLSPSLYAFSVSPSVTFFSVQMNR